MDDERNGVEVSFSENGERKCPYCKKSVAKDAVACPYCHGTFVSTNRVRNAVGMIVLIALLYWIISSIVSCEADREMKKINRQAEAMMKEQQKYQHKASDIVKREKKQTMH